MNVEKAAMTCGRPPMGKRQRMCFKIFAQTGLRFEKTSQLMNPKLPSFLTTDTSICTSIIYTSKVPQGSETPRDSHLLASFKTGLSPCKEFLSSQQVCPRAEGETESE